MPTQKKRKSKPRIAEDVDEAGLIARHAADPLAAEWDLPCGCVGSHGPDVTTCDHSCHWVHRFMFTESPLVTV